MKTYGEVEISSMNSLPRQRKEMSDQFYALAALSPGIYWSGGCVGLRAGSGRRGEEKKNPCPCRESNPGRLTHSLVTILTELRIGNDLFNDSVPALA
jgi:hypothetical protein